MSRSVGYAILGIAGYNPANCPGGANQRFRRSARRASRSRCRRSSTAGATSTSSTPQPSRTLDQFAIPEALDPDFAEGFGDLSVHEVAVDPQDRSLAYLSYYSGGLVAIQIYCDGARTTRRIRREHGTCELVEVGSYLDPEGNDFWGVETFVDEESGQHGDSRQRPRLRALDLRRPVTR